MNKGSRRILKVRDLAIAQNIASFLSEKKITPNQVSVISIFFALISALFLIAYSINMVWWYLIIVAIGIQLRLLCNLFDGMIAIEGGKSTKSGELFNDIPDRIADPLLLVSVGYAISNVSWSIEIAWMAGLFAIMTAYVRTLSTSIGAPIDFQGPMAKQHRMAVLTIACVLGAVERLFLNSEYSLLVALIIILLGSIVTCIKRTLNAYQYLERL